MCLEATEKPDPGNGVSVIIVFMVLTFVISFKDHNVL